MDKQKRVVVTGMGIVSPYGVGKDKFWNGLKNGKSGIGEIALFDTSKLSCKLAGEVKNFNAKKLLGKKGLRHLTRNTLFALAASKLALNDAGLACPVPEELAYSYGVSLGISTGIAQGFTELDREILKEGPRFIEPLVFPNVSPNATASQISIKFNIKGFNATISTSTSSSLDAIFYASNLILNHGYKIALAGGSEEMSFEVFIGLIKVKCLSSSKHDGDAEISCPYDRRRNGIIGSEGSCIFVLEEFEQAKKRKAKIYAELKGIGYSFDPRIRGGMNADAENQTEAIKQAILQAGYPKKGIECIIGSASSTKGGDYTEAVALKRAFGEKIKNIPVTSIKSMVGESFSAAGGFNIACALGVLKDNFIPPTINYKFPDKRCSLNIVANKAIRKKINNILVNSFSYNGHNSSIVIGKVDIDG